jgi:hypothetical protein
MDCGPVPVHWHHRGVDTRRSYEPGARRAPSIDPRRTGSGAESPRHPLLDLQRAAGNHAVTHLMGDLTVSRKVTKKARAPQHLSLGGNGAVVLDVGGTPVRVGTAGSDGAWVAVDASDRAVAVDKAKIGTIAPGPATPEATIVRARRATVEGATTAPSTTPTPVELTGPRQAVVCDTDAAAFGATLLAGGKGGWTAVDFGTLPGDLRTVLGAAPSAHIALDDGAFWSLMSFHLRDETTDTTRWVPAKKGTKALKEGLGTDAKKLPPDLQARFRQYLGTVTAVMAHEGTYGSRSPGSDPMASIGIFQWGMKKAGTKDTASSMGMFFSDLKRRADAAAKAGASPSPEQQLYIDAWKQCRDVGLDVDAEGRILLNGKPATGGQVEGVMAGSGPMSTGALKTYQLVAAMDWIEKFRTTLVRPGPSGSGKIGNGYAEQGNGSAVTLKQKSGGTTFRFHLQAPKDTAAVGGLLTSGRSTAVAVSLGVNRPHYVEAALWLAVCGHADPKADASGLLTNLVTALQAAKPAPGGKAGKKPKTRDVTVADVQALGKDAATDWTALQRLIWPAPKELDDAAETRLLAEFERRALTLYKAGDARKFHRERRFATAEAVSR